MTFDKNMEFLLSKFSHEIRNPLTTLYSTVQLIEMKHPEVKDFAHWSSLTYDIEYMNQLLDELSNFAKSERLNVETFAFRPFLEKLSLSFAASIAQSEVEYTSKIDSSITQITGDKTKLQEVFLNLLKNAYDAAKPNKTIDFTASLEGNSVVITVKDSGHGISGDAVVKGGWLQVIGGEGVAGYHGTHRCHGLCRSDISPFGFGNGVQPDHPARKPFGFDQRSKSPVLVDGFGVREDQQSGSGG